MSSKKLFPTLRTISLWVPIIFVLLSLLLREGLELETHTSSRHTFSDYKELAAKNVTFATLKLALLYDGSDSSLKLPLNYEKAAFYFQKTIENNERKKKYTARRYQLYYAQQNIIKKETVTALIHLAKLYDKGAGVKQNSQEAVNLLNKAQALGSKEAIFLLARIYEEGRPQLSPNQKLALQYYLASADMKHLEDGYFCAQDKLGSLYAAGKGLSQDDELAMYMFRQALTNKTRPYIEIIDTKIIPNNLFTAYVHYRLWLAKNSKKSKLISMDKISVEDHKMIEQATQSMTMLCRRK